MKKLWLVILALLIGIGAFKIVHLLTAGQIVTNASDRVPWGLRRESPPGRRPAREGRLAPHRHDLARSRARA